MQILKPIVHETIWGGDRLTKFAPIHSKKIGHLYSCIDNNIFNSEIIAGTYRDRSLHEWFSVEKANYGLERYDAFPVLMALVDATDNLSIQVHPDDDCAARLEHLPFGKNESFFILEAPTSGFMFNGCEVKSKEEFIKLINEGDCLSGVGKIPLSAGDYVYVEGGTLHAASKGALSFEIEENCDATYRFYDFDRVDANGRKRELQIDQALAALKIEKKSQVRRYTPGKAIKERMYSTELFLDGIEVNGCDNVIISVLLSGECDVDGISLLPGMAVIVEKNDKFNISTGSWMKVVVFPPVR